MAATWLRAIARSSGCWWSRIELVSPLPREECVRRIQEAASSSWGVVGSRPLIGRVGERSFTLRRRIGYRNSFQTYLRGVFEEESRQTRLRCLFGMRPAIIVFLMIWIGAVSLIAGAGIVKALAYWPPKSSMHLSDFGFPFMMLAFMVTLVGVGRFAARDEERYLVEFLVSTLDAREMPG